MSIVKFLSVCDTGQNVLLNEVVLPIYPMDNEFRKFKVYFIHFGWSILSVTSGCNFYWFILELLGKKETFKLCFFVSVLENDARLYRNSLRAAKRKKNRSV